MTNSKSRLQAINEKVQQASVGFLTELLQKDEGAFKALMREQLAELQFAAAFEAGVFMDFDLWTDYLMKTSVNAAIMSRPELSALRQEYLDLMADEAEMRAEFARIDLDEIKSMLEQFKAAEEMFAA